MEVLLVIIHVITYKFYYTRETQNFEEKMFTFLFSAYNNDPTKSFIIQKYNKKYIIYMK